ncbi:hypothetical protein Tco_1346079 [Tanacetum coccineum]
MQTMAGDDVAGIKRRRHDLSGDGVWILAMVYNILLLLLLVDERTREAFERPAFSLLSVVDTSMETRVRRKDTIGLKKQKKDDENEQLLLIFKQIHINLPFLEAMIHMPKGAKESAPKRRGPRKLHTSMSYQTPGSQERLG